MSLPDNAQLQFKTCLLAGLSSVPLSCGVWGQDTPSLAPISTCEKSDGLLSRLASPPPASASGCGDSACPSHTAAGQVRVGKMLRWCSIAFSWWLPPDSGCVYLNLSACKRQKVEPQGQRRRHDARWKPPIPFPQSRIFYAVFLRYLQSLSQRLCGRHPSPTLT